jgi:hypothetical protein
VGFFSSGEVYETMSPHSRTLRWTRNVDVFLIGGVMISVQSCSLG